MLLANCSILPVNCMRNSAVQRVFVPLVAEYSQWMQTAVWDDHRHCPRECRALAGIDWSDAMDTLPNEDSSCEDNSLSYWQAMKVAQTGRDMISASSPRLDIKDKFLRNPRPEVEGEDILQGRGRGRGQYFGLRRWQDVEIEDNITRRRHFDIGRCRMSRRKAEENVTRPWPRYFCLDLGHVYSGRSRSP